DQPGMICADYPRIDAERGLERPGTVAGEIAIIILLVHEDIGARLQLGEGSKFDVDAVGPGARSGDDAGSKACVGQCGGDRGQIIGLLNDRRTAFGKILDMLLRAAIILNAAIAERWKRRDRPSELNRLFGRSNSGPRDPWID